MALISDIWCPVPEALMAPLRYRAWSTHSTMASRS